MTTAGQTSKAQGDCDSLHALRFQFDLKLDASSSFCIFSIPKIIMRLSGSRAYYRPTPPKMPTGLVELIEGLTREVLKNNPTEIYGFCAGYVHQLLEIRDGPLHLKTLTLEEKIARAQLKVRQRAEKRRQQINYDLHLTLLSGKGTECNVISNNVNLPSPSQISSVVDTVHIPIHHEQESLVLSEVEISHDKESYTQNREPPLVIIDSEIIKDDDNDIINKDKYKNNSNLVGITNQESNFNIAKEDIDLYKPLIADYDVKEVDMLDNDTLSDETILKLDVGPESHGQTTQDENLHFQVFQKFASAERISSSPPNSMLVNQHFILIDSGETIIEDPELPQDGVVSEANIEQDRHDSLTQTDGITNSVIESQNDVVHLSIIREETQIKPVKGDTHSAEQSTDNIVIENDEDIMESKSIDISYKESPTVELQDPLDNSSMLESQLEITSDGDILTLLTQDSNNAERKEHITLNNDSLNSEESDKIIKNDKSIASDSIPEVCHKNTECINKNDVIENFVVVSNNEKKSNSENDTAKELSVGSQNSQDSSNIMDLETAAITIQKVFRTFLFKSRASTFDAVNDEAIFLNETDENKENCNFANQGCSNERRPHGITRMDTVLQTVNEEKSLSLSTDDSSTLSSAATVIQAHVRGFLVRNKINSNKTLSNSSLAASHSNEPSVTSLEIDNDQNKSKTVLNIHIVPDGGNYLSRDESLITSMDLSLDSSPPSSINLHPLGYDKSERRKQLKREDAIQSISPPSNNSGKLSEDVDSVKELPLNDHDVKNNSQEGKSVDDFETTNAENTTFGPIVNSNEISVDVTHIRESSIQPKKESLSKMSSDEMDVVTPFMSNEDNNCSDTKLMHSGEFHDAVLPTKVSRGDTSVASGE